MYPKRFNLLQIEAEQQIWNECSRLITNRVIYYNAVLLSRVYEQKQAVSDGGYGCHPR